MRLDDWSERHLSPESPLIRILGKYADLMVLNILWLLCSLPIFTIGASTMALFQGVTAVREDIGSPKRVFFKTFRMKFRKATLAWLMVLVVGCGILYNIVFALTIQVAWKILLIGVWVLLAFLYLVCVSYLFPILAKHDLPIKKAVKAAFFVGMSKLENTLAVIVLNAIPVVMALFFPYYFLHLLLAWLLFGFSLIAFADAWLVQKVFLIIDPSDDPAKEDAFL